MSRHAIFWLVSTYRQLPSARSSTSGSWDWNNLPRGGEEDANGIEGIGQPALVGTPQDGKVGKFGSRFQVGPKINRLSCLVLNWFCPHTHHFAQQMEENQWLWKTSNIFQAFWRKWKAIEQVIQKAKEPRDKSLGWCSEKSGPICVSVHDNLAQILVWLERCSPQTPRSPMPKIVTPRQHYLLVTTGWRKTLLYTAILTWGFQDLGI